MMPPDLIKELKRAKKVCVLTGAGISAESGVPTFREKDGLWSKLNPQELASMEGFLKNPDLVWKWYSYRREIISKVSVNPGHLVLARMESMFDTFTLITQNVDGLHRKAGSKNILELHGNINKNFCLECKFDKFEETLFEGECVPTCPKCGGKIRPAVVWFGEMLPADILNEAQKASLQAEIFFSIGTSALVQPAASMPIWSKRSGGLLVEINKDRTPISDMADYFLEGQSGEILPQIEKLLQI